MVSLKADNFLRPFHGKTSKSWKQFWDKFVVLADIQGWDTETKRMTNFHLFLDGDAFLIYSGMADRKQESKVVMLMTTS